jgi:hypothetical protein
MHGDAKMAKSNAPMSAIKVKTVRSTVSFPADQYDELERIAESHNVSVAWVVRAAVSKYLAEQWPLFPEHH